MQMQVGKKYYAYDGDHTDETELYTCLYVLDDGDAVIARFKGGYQTSLNRVVRKENQGFWIEVK